MSIPVFINLESNNQLDELRSYLSSKGIVMQTSAKDLDENIKEIITNAESLWNETGTEYDLEMVYNSIISMVIVMPRESITTPTTLLCTILQKAAPSPDKRNASKLKLLNNLFAGLEDSSPLRYTVYSSLVSLAGQADLLHLINIKLSLIKEWVGEWGVGLSKHQALLRHIHQAYRGAKQTEKASKVMVELLCTYTKENAAMAREDARSCIISCIGDPSVLVIDHLLLSEPVKFLEGEPIHDLLSLFVVGSLKEYTNFQAQHSDFVTSTALCHQQNIKKMRLLTFCSLAETNAEVMFEVLMDELQLKDDEVESFLSEVLKSKVAQIRIEQTKRKVLIYSSISRTFSNQQWMKLYKQLESWRGNLDVMSNSLESVMATAAAAN